MPQPDEQPINVTGAEVTVISQDDNNPENFNGPNNEPVEDPLEIKIREMEAKKNHILREQYFEALEDEVKTLQTKNPILRFLRRLDDKGYLHIADVVTSLLFAFSIIMTIISTFSGNVNTQQALYLNMALGVISGVSTWLSGKYGVYGLTPSYSNYISPLTAKTEDETETSNDTYDNESGGA